jgi:hypothetical protein
LIVGKRSEFPKIQKDKYHTPREAVFPLLSQLPAGTVFAEPCAGNGILIDHLKAAGHSCVWAGDIEPERNDIWIADALNLTAIQADMFITNPPWTRSSLHPIIAHLSAMLPCWFLFDADWPHTRQSEDLIGRCSKIVPVGRIKWIPGSAHVGKDNCCWYEFLPGHTIGPRLVPRQIKRESRPEAIPIRATNRDQITEIARAATPVSFAPSSTALLARLRGKMRPMNIPKLTADIADSGD